MEDHSAGDQNMDGQEDSLDRQTDMMLSERNWLVGWLSGGFTPCRHLRPSSGREHTIVTYSVR